MLGRVKKRWIGVIVGGAMMAAVAAVLVIWHPASLYPWFKAFHVIAVMSWMAGMLYLPRLFVYHCAAEKGSKQSETFKVMEHRLLRLIMNPAMIVVWVTGPWLAWWRETFNETWVWAQLGLVALLVFGPPALGLWRSDL